uniref:Odorant-binding protein 15 n=1 Tax=Ectropis obliqua TaxID=248899 RepID=A0A1L2BLA9_ECTOB|nr:odorant-binding protein 15 [Ectropis obliqua]
MTNSTTFSKYSVMFTSFIFLTILTLSATMTMKQLRSTGKMMRKSCQPKNNVEDEKIDPIADGVFIEEQEVKCYIACIMKMANAIKNGKLNYEAAIKQADLLLPDEIKEPAKESITVCRKVSDQYKDICEASFHTTKCIYNNNPAAFYFP